MVKDRNIEPPFQDSPDVEQNFRRLAFAGDFLGPSILFRALG